MDHALFDRLSEAFSVRDIMTPVRLLKRAATRESAAFLLHEFDVVPYPREGEIQGFFVRSNDGLAAITPELLIGDRTGLLELLCLLAKRPFYFVLSGNTVSGYVHYSDLNKRMTRIPLFALFETLERDLWEKIQNRVSLAVLEHLFQPYEVKKFLRRQKEIREGNVDLGWTGVFTFPYIMRMARYFGALAVDDHEIRDLKNTRNKIAHTDAALVSKYDDVAELHCAYRMACAIIDQ